jgi:hypothetical protein
MAIHRNLPSNVPPVKIGDTIIPYSTKVKNLGVIIICNQPCNDQISSIVSSVNGALSRLVVALLLSQSSMGNRDRLNKCYNSCARYVYNIRSSESRVYQTVTFFHIRASEDGNSVSMWP